MAIFKTDKLIHHYLKLNKASFAEQGKTIIRPITDYFDHEDTRGIQQLLLSHGLFHPEQTKKGELQAWLMKDFSLLIEQSFKQLQQEWQGPTPDIFVFPADLNQKKLTDQFGGVSGLSFVDKIFIFINEHAADERILATLAHEYSHSLRLTKVHNGKQVISLADAIILEGIAEVITNEKYNLSLLPMSKQQDPRREELWHKWIKPHLNVQSNHPLHHFLMYGNDHIPDYTGYKIGTSIVKEWQATHQVSLIELLHQPTRRFFSSLPEHY